MTEKNTHSEMSANHPNQGFSLRGPDAAAGGIIEGFFSRKIAYREKESRVRINIIWKKRRIGFDRRGKRKNL